MTDINPEPVPTNNVHIVDVTITRTEVLTVRVPKDEFEKSLGYGARNTIEPRLDSLMESFIRKNVLRLLPGEDGDIARVDVRR